MAAEQKIVVKPTELQFTAPNTVQDQIFGAVLVYRYTGEFLLFSYPYMELWRIR